ncbi:MAG: phosphate ABC transporter permease PstA [Puniceicoccales bacterium]|jgi:phosphate transport system permease protein|nr:phosphate ABC transporter permease PstA [Puniceicoccales bacterium]
MENGSQNDTGNPFAATNIRGATTEKAVFVLLRTVTLLLLFCGFAVIGRVAIKGTGTVLDAFERTDTFPWFTNTFLTRTPETLHVFKEDGQMRTLGDSAFRTHQKAREEDARVRGETPTPLVVVESHAHAAGGILPCLAGSALLTGGSMLIALLLGVSCAIYLSEYAGNGRFVRLVRLSILNLAGVPSIVFGLFGFSLFVTFFGWNVSLLAGWCTLALMALPAVITASEEALRAVPTSWREGGLALGATHWQVIQKNVLPRATPGLLTAAILGVARVAGETAPIMFTAAYVVRNELPWEAGSLREFVFQGVMALPYHIYVISAKVPQNEFTEKTQYGTALVYLVFVMLFAAAAVISRNRLRPHRG